ncbi:hypothetical protein GJ496_001621 [Pomphorhynchus laevis]|nr:hypothetical protein GJ496_001621 [Pomphorhynchus laevis]
MASILNVYSRRTIFNPYTSCQQKLHNWFISISRDLHVLKLWIFSVIRSALHCITCMLIIQSYINLWQSLLALSPLTNRLVISMFLSSFTLAQHRHAEKDSLRYR